MNVRCSIPRRVRVSSTSVRSLILASALVATIALTGCSSGKAPMGHVSGTLQVGATNVLPGYPGLIHAVRSGNVVASTRTHQDGSFDMALAPGSYVFTGAWQDVCTQPCDWTRACGQSDAVTLTAKRTTTVLVTCHLK